MAYRNLLKLASFILVVRGYLTRLRIVPEIERRRRAVILIQAQSRGYIQRKLYEEETLKAKKSATLIQAGG